MSVDLGFGFGYIAGFVTAELVFVALVPRAMRRRLFGRALGRPVGLEPRTVPEPGGRIVPLDPRVRRSGPGR